MPSGLYTTGQLAAAAGCSVQQVRDLERLGVIPPAQRLQNGYRRFTSRHLVALRAYRSLAFAVGPVAARSTMGALHALPHDEAVARIVDLHVGLARSRDDTAAAVRALDSIVEDSARDAAPLPGDTMSITELSAAIGVRPSTLRFWEDEGLISADRPDRASRRRYPPAAVRDVRIVAALRAGGYRIPAVRAVMESLRDRGGGKDAVDALQARLQTLAARSTALLRAGADLATLLEHENQQRADTAPPRVL